MAPGFETPNPTAFEIALLCVLKCEQDAIEHVLDEIYENDGLRYRRAQSDRNAYTTGRLGNHHVVVVHLPAMGNIDSAAAASAIRATFPAIHLILVVGVCGVNPKLRDENGGEVLLGDVIISTGLVKAGSGRQYEDGVALRRQTELPPHVDVRAFLQKLQSAKTTDRLRTRTASYTSTLLESFNKEGMRPVPTEDKLFPSGYRHKHQNPDICDVCALCHGNSDAVCLDASVSSCEELGCDDTLLITRRRLQDATSKVSGNSDIANAQSPTLWFGPFASAEFVMKSGHHRDKLARENHVVAFEMEGGGTWEFLPTIIVKGACDYADSHKHKAWQQYSATTAAACAKAMVEEWRTIQPHLAEMAEFAYEELGRSRAPGLDAILKDIPHVPEAAFDSFAMQNVPFCHENTRVKLLSDICTWATAKESLPVFWLQGIAGTGKTTIAKTVARTFTEQNSLAASFFFSRGAGDRGTANKVIGTLVHQLCLYPTLEPHISMGLRSLVCDTISSNPSIFTKAYAEQFDHLLLRPILQLQTKFPDYHSEPLLIVIDAVDECDPIQDIGLLIELLATAQRLVSIPLRFFLTGRPETEVTYRIRRVSYNVNHITLHNIESSLVAADILIFVKDKFRDIRERLHYSDDWPTAAEIDLVVSKSCGLFIYAATVCRVLGARHSKHLLRRFIEDDNHANSNLDEMYNLILVQALVPTDDAASRDAAIQSFRLIIGSMAALFDTLSINELHCFLIAHRASSEADGFLQAFDHDEIEETLRHFGSVLEIPENDRDLPVRIFHPSFREYLFKPRREGLGYAGLNPGDTHEMLLRCCLDSMCAYLRKDICQVGSQAQVDNTSTSWI